jgi:hypothetical protein
MAEAATAIRLSLQDDSTNDAKNTAALAATGDLRLQVAHALYALPFVVASRRSAAIAGNRSQLAVVGLARLLVSRT